MVNEAIYSYLIYDGSKFKANNISIVRSMKKKSVYEVIRVIDRVPLFFDEHVERMHKSAELVGIKLCLSRPEIYDLIQKLMDINNEYNSNIKLLFSEDGRHYYLYFMHTFYPSHEMYEQGIHTVLYDVERHNPNAKINDFQLREHIKQYRVEQGAFEALLVNDKQLITEGSRSNIFFVDNQALYTAPNKKVLIGITRNKVLEVARRLNIRVYENEIGVERLGSFRGAFMTSTSNDILPIKSIDRVTFQSTTDPLILRLKTGYQNEVLSYLKGHKKRS